MKYEYLDDWQKEVLNYKGDLLLCTGRRIGKTLILAQKAVETMVKYSKKIVVVSLTEDQAMIILEMAKAYAMERYPKLIGKRDYKPKLREFTLMINKKPVKMISRPVGNTGDASRGFEGGVLIVDEAARMPKTFWIAAKPILLTQAGEIWMASTLWGRKGYFWERFNEAYNLKRPDARFKVFCYTTEEVMENRKISEVWTKQQREGALRILAYDKEEMSQAEYAQEYLAVAHENMRQYFSDEIIESACVLDKTKVRTNKFGINSLGVDVARMGGDEIAYEGLELFKDKKRLEQRENIIETKKRTTEVTMKILELYKKYLHAGIYVDSAGVGAGVFDQLLMIQGVKRKVRGIENAAKTIDPSKKKKRRILKDDLMENLLWLLENKKILLFNDDKIKNSLRSIQVEFNENTGNTKFIGKDSHIVEGLTRAAWIIKDKVIKLWIHCR